MRGTACLPFGALLVAGAGAQSLPKAPAPRVQLRGADPAASSGCDAAMQQSERLIRAQTFAEAIAAARGAVAACPPGAAPFLLLARAQMLSGAFADAAATIQGMLSKDPHNLDGLVLLGQAEYLRGDERAAADAFQRAIDAAPQSPRAQYWLGRMLYQEGSVPQAVAHLQAALRIDPADYQADDALGLCYQALGKDDLAQKSFLQAVALVFRDHPQYDTVYADYAELLLHLNDAKQAFDLAAEGAERNPANGRDFLLAGRALQQAGDEQRSVDWLKQAVKLDPANPEPHYLLAQAYRRLGQQDEAAREIVLFKQCTAKAPIVRR